MTNDNNRNRGYETQDQYHFGTYQMIPKDMKLSKVRCRCCNKDFDITYMEYYTWFEGENVEYCPREGWVTECPTCGLRIYTTGLQSDPEPNPLDALLKTLFVIVIILVLVLIGVFIFI